MVKDIYEKWLSNNAAYKKVYDYYLGNTDAILNYESTDRSNLKVNCNYLKKFVREETSYSVGNSIAYTSKSGNEEGKKIIDLNFENLKENHDINSFRNMVLFGLSYEIYFIDKFGLFNSRIVLPTQAAHIEDSEENTLEFGWIYDKEETVKDKKETTRYIDYFTIDKIETYKVVSETNFKLIESKEHYFKEVPVGVAKVSEETYKDTLYVDIKGLQDALETNLSDIVNEISDFRNAYLVLTGIALENDDAARMKSNGILEIPVADGKAEWLIKNINDVFIQNTLKTLQEKLYEMSSHINTNDNEQMSNASGVALKSRLINLTQKCYINQNSFKELLKTRLRILATYLMLTNNTSYDWRDINIKYTPLIPSDDVSNAQLISMLDGKLSAATGLELLSFIEDGKAEYNKAQEELLIDVENEVVENE